MEENCDSYQQHLEHDNLTLLQSITQKESEIAYLAQKIKTQEQQISALQALVLEQTDKKTQYDVQQLKQNIDKACPRVMEQKERQAYYHAHKNDYYILEEARRLHAQNYSIPLWKHIQKITDRLFDTYKQHDTRFQTGMKSDI